MIDLYRLMLLFTRNRGSDYLHMYIAKRARMYHVHDKEGDIEIKTQAE